MVGSAADEGSCFNPRKLVKSARFYRFNLVRSRKKSLKNHSNSSNEGYITPKNPADAQILTAASARGASASSKERRALFVRFFTTEMLPHWRWYASALVLMAFYSASMVALPWFLETAVDDILIARNSDAVREIALLTTVIFLTRAISGFGQKYLLQRIGLTVITNLQKRVATHVLSLDMAFFHKNETGQITARVFDDANVLLDFASRLLLAVGRDSLTMIAIIIYLMWNYPGWTLLAAFGGPMIALPGVMANRRLRKLAHQLRENVGKTLTAFEEGFHGIRTIKAEGAEKLEEARIEGIISQRFRAGERTALVSSAMAPVVDIVTLLAIVGILYVGGNQVVAGTAEPGSLVGFFAGIMILYEPLKRLIALNAILQTSFAAMERIYEVFDLKPQIVDRPEAKPVSQPLQHIALSSISYGYGNKTVFDDLSMTISGGKSSVIIGGSGTGKTTLFNLLTRLDDPLEGTIAIGEQDIRDLKSSSLRQNVSLVAQDALLFDATIAQNIAYGSQNASTSDIERVARLALVDEFVSTMSDGYGHRVGPRGARLSGGQRQRIGIARALLRDTPILFLDEATSSLDAETEQKVFNAILEQRAGKTTIIIAHRISALTKVDEFFLLDHGQLVDHGTFDDLASRSPQFSAYLKMQGVATP